MVIQAWKMRGNFHRLKKEVFTMRKAIDRNEFVYQVAADGTVKYICKNCGHEIQLKSPDLKKPEKCPQCGFEFEKE